MNGSISAFALPHLGVSGDQLARSGTGTGWPGLGGGGVTNPGDVREAGSGTDVVYGLQLSKRLAAGLDDLKDLSLPSLPIP